MAKTASVVTKAPETGNVAKTEQVQLPDLSAFTTKSAQIRHLANIGWSRGQIAKGLGIRYQHVRNVLIQPLKRGPQA